MVNYNEKADSYNAMTIEQLETEANKPGLYAEDKTLILHLIARKRGNNVNSVELKPVAEDSKVSKK